MEIANAFTRSLDMPFTPSAQTVAPWRSSLGMMTAMSHPPATKIVAPYGTWPSPFTADVIAQGSVVLGQPAIDGEDVYFTEVRPAEKGRSALVRCAPGGTLADVCPPEHNVRTRVHEYGGGDYLVVDGTVYFSSFADQRIYRQDPGAAPRPITPPLPLRFADYRLDRRRRRILCVREDKRLVESREDVNTIVAVDPDGDDAGGRVLVSGNEFYAAPRISPDGSRLAWLTWGHPYMPWDAAELWVGRITDDGAIAGARRVAGGAGESIAQPEWAADGTLYFMSDRTDFWNLHRERDGRVEAVCVHAADFAAPQWVLGSASYAFVGPETVLVAYSERAVWRLGTIDTRGGALTPIDSPFAAVASLRGAPGWAVFVASAPARPPEVVRFDLAARRVTTLRRSTELTVDPDAISVPEAIEFPTANGLTAHGFLYRPKSRTHVAPDGEKPPLIVRSHGGPTSQANCGFNLAVQYWTARGFAFLDVNYGGSSGFGRAYRDRLNGRWGIVDVEDCEAGARHLVARGEVDGARLAITGGSAGGYTTLRALTTGDFFKAGASHYGISDLEQLARDARTGNNHKFESRCDEILIAPYPDRVDVFRERSPIHHADRLSRPVIFFQGLEDLVVLPNQAERMVEVLRKKRLPVAYVAFEGEGHGFRRAENIKRALDGELCFYGRVFGFEPAGPLATVDIENLP
jgi:dipeptidyl aminopeptidase/acylaminoacyl peptidase